MQAYNLYAQTQQSSYVVSARKQTPDSREEALIGLVVVFKI
jgi:hypothetical protein